MELSRDLDFVSAFRTRREFCRALLEVSRQQAALIASDDYAELLDVLGHKQRLLDGMRQHTQQTAAVWSQWRQARDGLPEKPRSTCEQLLAETEAILAELVAHEKDSTDLLTTRREATQRELLAVSRGAHAHEAYRDHLAPMTHRHLNING